MTTQTLIELQRSITQGEWRLEDVKAQTLLNVVPKNQQKAFKRNSAIADYYQIASVATSFCRTKSPSGFEHPKLPEGQALANGKAVALVPELIAEVIRLREVLEESAALNENFVSVSEPETLCHLSEYRAVIKQCRAALANAK